MVMTPHREAQDTGDKANTLYASGRLRVMADTYTFPAAAGAAGVPIDYPRLLQGRVIVFPALSYLVSSQGAATANISIGHRAYRNSNGDTVAEDFDEFILNADAGGGAIDAYWTAVTGFVGAEDVREFDAQDGLQIFVTVDTADMDLGDVIKLVVFYAHVN